MNPKLATRVITEALYIVKYGATVRQASQALGGCKSTIFKDVTERLMYIDPDLYTLVRKVLDINKEERHIRGGAATKRKYQK